MSDVLPTLAENGISLEARALQAFGAAIAAPLPDRFALAGTRETVSKENIAGGSLNPPAYAHQNASVSGGMPTNAPKLKFLFKISFHFNPEMIEYVSRINGENLADLMRTLDFVVKQVDLPTFEFDYEEVNMYNFRTKVLKQIRHKEMNLTFYDDIGNKALNFINIYRMLFSPIARRERPAVQNLDEYGLSFNNDPNSLNTSIRGPLPGDRFNVLSKIVVHQYYNDFTANIPVKVNDFVFVNPKISNMSISDQDHENGQTANQITCAFDFDTVFIETGQNGLRSDHARSPLAVLPVDIGSDERLTSTILPGGPARRPTTSNVVFYKEPPVRLTELQSITAERMESTLYSLSSGKIGGLQRPLNPLVVDTGTGSADVVNLTSRV